MAIDLSTHVLDTSRGRPGAGIRVELYRLTEGGRQRVASAATNADGRTDEPLLAGEAARPGLYELLFHVGDYFAAADTPAFYDVIPVRCRLEAGHYHVPLLLAPWSYATYRGS